MDNYKSLALELKKANQQLAEENRRFKTIMDVIDSVMYVADFENHEILFANKYSTRLYGEIIGKKCYSALQGKSMPCDFCTNHLLRDKNGKVNSPHIWEFQNLITKRWYQCHDQAVHWTNGKLVRFEIATDITKNVEYELALKENEQKLREFNSTKDKLFSIIAHDLKNPLAVLFTSSELLSMHLERSDIAKSKAKAEMILKASQNVGALMENLLVWAKSQTGNIRYSPKDLPIRSYTEGIISEIDIQAKKKNISIFNLVPENLTFKADEHLLAVVLRNLITNAIKFTPNNGTITIIAKTDYRHVEMGIIDTGIGIAKEHHDKLFRIDAGYPRPGTANEASTGLGLIICKEFIEKHKGSIWVESDSEKGSTFKFTLPL